ncbi:MAG: LPS export ABC transporter ATP-binding protein [Gemmatimonadetes bacterium]|uniref:LPS export ABC transporter ATP-binding protein n=1 Tax=Candidatus Kutchimonas denitrificans TaxID=3056748 RepID=A0AAE4Z8J0_9BACT|nr:LPS export ABC transporter ATP-binding protein [Gemmatimonadota bacterium]NIR75244.1 LPS export ABC transporter ATP-binding protein [Candidatus Kutchimonas denitrificans]NIS00182.1 LPS export ABC transporter ATP-binding protein [Gemmatimonadota bacterium]NIT65774.1 LPS export ABC transporter ATP-binding protein [Gemmatimonadota bacterium]NIU53052.1 LPS export ABC transporter ATP-binding protein [Gemmatimonadota bacterium]
MTTEQVDSYLSEQILARLEAEGLLEQNGDEPGARLVLSPTIRSDVGRDRTDIQQLLDREIEKRLLAPEEEPEPRRIVPDGSRIATDGLVKVYKRRRVVDDVDLSVRQGEIVGLLGPNGAGKTTTFYMIVGLVAPDAGEVFIDQRPLSHVPMYRRARLGIGYLSQEPSVFRKLTVEENIEAILETLSISEEEKSERLESLLDELSIKHLRENRAYSLSGGERRRLEITRALVTDPKFMLLDEPFAGVDPIAVDDIQRIVADLKHRGLGVLITDHNVRETLSITDRAYIMFDGKIHIEGTSEELVNDPQARKLYLGEDFRL